MYDWYKTFMVLAKCKSFTETAKRLFCSQPTVTQHIQQLEKSFGCPLIIRNKRQIELTMQGELVLQHTQLFFKQEQELRNTLVQMTDTKKLPIYLSTYISSHYFDEIFDEEMIFSATSPYEVHSFDYTELKQCLIDEKASFATMPIYSSDQLLTEQFNIEVFFDEELVLVMAKDHPLTKRQVLYARDLINYTIFLPQSEHYGQNVKFALMEKDVLPNYVQMPNFNIIKQAIERSMGIAFLPRKVFEHDLSTLQQKAIKGMTIQRQIGVVFNKQSELNQKELVFLQQLKCKLVGAAITSDRPHH